MSKENHLTQVQASMRGCFYNDSALKNKKRKCILSSQRCHDWSCPFNNCKDPKVLSSASHDELRNLFYIDAHEILWSAFECIESDSLFKSAIKKSLLMEVALLQRMRIEVRFDQEPSMNGLLEECVQRL